MLSELDNNLKQVCDQSNVVYGGLLTLSTGAELHIMVQVNGHELFFQGIGKEADIVDHITRAVSSHIAMERAFNHEA